ALWRRRRVKFRDRRAIGLDRRLDPPAAEFARIYMEAQADIEAEAGRIGFAAPAMDRAQPGHQILAGDRIERHQVDRLPVAVRAFLGAARAAVERWIAVDRYRLDRTDGRNNHIADETQRFGQFRPFRRGRHLEG